MTAARPWLRRFADGASVDEAGEDGLALGHGGDASRCAAEMTLGRRQRDVHGRRDVGELLVLDEPELEDAAAVRAELRENGEQTREDFARVAAVVGSRVRLGELAGRRQ